MASIENTETTADWMVVDRDVEEEVKETEKKEKEEDAVDDLRAIGKEIEEREGKWQEQLSDANRKLEEAQEVQAKHAENIARLEKAIDIKETKCTNKVNDILMASALVLDTTASKLEAQLAEARGQLEKSKEDVQKLLQVVQLLGKERTVYQQLVWEQNNRLTKAKEVHDYNMNLIDSLNMIANINNNNIIGLQRQDGVTAEKEENMDQNEETPEQAKEDTAGNEKPKEENDSEDKKMKSTIGKKGKKSKGKRVPGFFEKYHEWSVVIPASLIVIFFLGFGTGYWQSGTYMAQITRRSFCIAQWGAALNRTMETCHDGQEDWTLRRYNELLSQREKLFSDRDSEPKINNWMVDASTVCYAAIENSKMDSEVKVVAHNLLEPLALCFQP